VGLALVAGLLALPALAAAVSLLGRHWYSTGDQALEVLLIGDVGGRHTPLVGMPSRLGWYHPGPLLFWLLAPMAHLFGETGVLAGVAIINAAALVGVAIVARRRGGAALLLWAGLLVAALVHTEGPGLLLDPWNPYVPVLPFLCFVMLAWSVACGDYPALPWAVVVGSFVVEAHVGYALLVAGSLAVALAIPAVRTLPARRAPPLLDDPRPSASGLSEGPGAARALGRRRPARPRAAIWLAVAVGVGLAAWIGPLLQQLAGHPGNLGQVVQYFRHPSGYSQPGQMPGPVGGWGTAFGIMGRQLTPPGPWLTGSDTSASGYAATAAAWPAVLLLAATAGAGLLAWRRGAGDAARLALVALALAALGLAATANVTGGLFPYVIRWWWVVGLVLWLAIGWCLFAALSEVRVQRWPVGLLVAAGGVALVALTLAAALPAPLPNASESEAVAHLAPSTARALPAGRRYLVVWNDPQEAYATTPVGMFTDLERRSVNVVLPAANAFGFGARRTTPPASYSGVVTIVGVPDPAVRPPPPPGGRLIASYDPLPAGQRREADRLQEQIRDAQGPRAGQGALVVPGTPLGKALLVLGGAPASDVNRLAALQAKGSPYEVFFSPLGT
jgi:hypothetical protein